MEAEDVGAARVQVGRLVQGDGEVRRQVAPHLPPAHAATTVCQVAHCEERRKQQSTASREPMSLVLGKPKTAVSKEPQLG